MKKIESFTNLYPLSKTLRFQLIPQGKTEENFEKALILENDEKLAENYGAVKGLMDEYHKAFIEHTLKGQKLTKLSEYADLYCKERGPGDNLALTEFAASMRKEISDRFTKDPLYKKLFGNEMIRELLPAFFKGNPEALEAIESLAQFTTYFVGFYDNRKNIYSGEGKATEIAFRIVDQNLPKFLDNMKNGILAMETLPKEAVDAFACDYAELFKLDVQKLFTVDYFNSVLSQSGIDEYNQVLGGYSKEDGTKVKGLNEYINLYNQTNEKRLPKLKMLYKQILSDRSTVSFVQDAFDSDENTLKAIYGFWIADDNETGISPEKVLAKLDNMFASWDQYDPSGIYLASGPALSGLSNGAFGSWNLLQDGLNAEYDAENRKKPPKDIEKYEEKRKTYFKKIESFALSHLEGAAGLMNEEAGKIAGYIQSHGGELIRAVLAAYSELLPLLAENYPETKKLANDDAAIEKIKLFLDGLKELQLFCKNLLGSGKEEQKDDIFYGEFLPLYETLSRVTPLYNKVRNYVTKKPYSDEKIKLNFANSQLLGGWDENKIKDYTSVLLEQDGAYYLGIINKDHKKIFDTVPKVAQNEPKFHRMVYKLLPGPNKMLPKVFFSKSRISEFAPSEEVMRIYANETFKKGPSFSLRDCHTLIDFYKNSIQKHEDWQKFGFEFRRTEEYENIGQFYKDVKDQGYKISFEEIPENYIMSLVSEGRLYLFRIYNKDFSQFSKGTPNLHTLYFKMLFDKDNLSNPVFALNGGAEMFYRKPSISKEDQIVHPANKPIPNKNLLNEKKESIFTYDLIKDKRYTHREFFLHIPVSVNFQAEGGVNVNMAVREALRASDENYVIGIDRGERNLLYVCVINGKGEIVEQMSMNSILANGHETDYHALLDEREKGRTKARQDWKTIGNISNLKEGYVSQVVHKICELVEKYDAVIAMEDLNSGFKNSRVKVEKQVYQKFEKMLIDKLNFYADKKKNPAEFGGLLKAYQLTEKFESFAKMGKQNGFIFYIPAWLTSKIDPTTGFVDLLKPRYESMEKAVALLRNFDDIRYNSKENYFEFDLDYNKFPKGSTDFHGKWTVTSYGKRIVSFRNPDKNSEWDSKEIDLTEELKAVLQKNGISWQMGDLQDKLCSVENSGFYREFIRVLAFVFQMRNSDSKSGRDYLASPVKNRFGKFYNSEEYSGRNAKLPADADANGAYHIARKAQWAIEQIQAAPEDELRKVNLAISNREWLKYIQG